MFHTHSFRHLSQALRHLTKQTREAMYIEKRSCNHRCSGKAIRITQPECVFVAFGIKHAQRLRHIVICGLPCSTIFFHIISETLKFSKKKLLNKLRISIFSAPSV
jgi:hypothetical protein